MLAAVLAAAALALLCEWRLQTLIVDGAPANPLAWSPLRLALGTSALFLALAPLTRWIWRGGPAKAWGRLRARGGELGRRAALGAGVAVAAGLWGWIGGWVVAVALANPLDGRYPFAFAGFAVAAALLVLFRKSVLADGAWGFLIVGSTMAAVLVGLMPLQAIASWDGPYHFDVANALSYGERAEYDSADLVEMGMPYPLGSEGEPGIGDEPRVWPRMDAESVAELERLLADAPGSGPPTVEEGTGRHGGSTWLMPSAVGHVPSALGLWAARLLDFDNVGEYRAARAASAAVYVLAWFFGIRYLRSSKLVFSVIALTPVGLYLAANFGYDSFLIAMVGLMTCRFIGELQRPGEPLTPARGAAILVPYVLGCLVKAVYFPLGLVLLAMPRGKFPGAGEPAPSGEAIPSGGPVSSGSPTPGGAPSAGSAPSVGMVSRAIKSVEPAPSDEPTPDSATSVSSLSAGGPVPGATPSFSPIPSGELTPGVASSIGPALLGGPTPSAGPAPSGGPALSDRPAPDAAASATPGTFRGRLAVSGYRIWVLAVAGSALFLVLTFLLPLLFQGVGTFTDARGGEGVDAAAQIATVLANPLGHLGVLASTALQFLGPASFRDATAMIWYLPLSPAEEALGWIYLALLLGVALLGRRPADRRFGGATVRLTAAVGLLGAYGLVASSLYVSFTAVGAPLVAGLQPRYLLPLLPALLGITLNVPALGRALPRGSRRLAAAVVWAALLGYYLAFIILRFVVFFA